jgi:hypothetical protein
VLRVCLRPVGCGCARGGRTITAGVSSPRRRGLIGVHPCGRNWQAKVERDGENFYLGPFDDKIEAARARDRKAAELFGQFAYLNFPEEVEGR